MKKFKFAAIASFCAFAIVAFAFSGNYSEAQTKKSANKDAQLLSAVAEYKNWRQIAKQEPLMGLVKSPSSTEATLIINSTAMG